MFNIIYISFFFNDTATTEIYTLSLHDALPISRFSRPAWTGGAGGWTPDSSSGSGAPSNMRPFPLSRRSEEHTSELQSRQYLVCRLLLEKKNQNPFLLSHSAYEFHHTNSLMF